MRPPDEYGWRYGEDDSIVCSRTMLELADAPLNHLLVAPERRSLRWRDICLVGGIHRLGNGSTQDDLSTRYSKALIHI
jgi:hypothetical protein